MKTRQKNSALKEISASVVFLCVSDSHHVVLLCVSDFHQCDVTVFQTAVSVVLLCFRPLLVWCGVFSRRPAAWCHCVSDLYWCGVVYFSGVRQRGVIVCFRPLLAVSYTHLRAHETG